MCSINKYRDHKYIFFGMFSFSKSRSRNVTTQLYYTNTMRLIVNPLCIVDALFSSSTFIQCANAMQPSVDIITMNFWHKTFMKDNYFDSSEIITTPQFYYFFLNNTNFAKNNFCPQFNYSWAYLYMYANERLSLRSNAGQL